MPSLIARVVKAGSRLTIRHQPKSADALVRHLRRTMGNPPMVTCCRAASPGSPPAPRHRIPECRKPGPPGPPPVC